MKSTQKSSIALILGAAGAGKSRLGEQKVKRHKQKLFLAITAALVQTAPKTFLKQKMTIAAFLTRKVKVKQETVIYIDEISMVDAKTMDRIFRQNPDNNYILIGDQFQIQPIQDKLDDPQKCWWFTSDEYKKRKVETTVLKTQHRLKGTECKDIRTIIEEMATFPKSNEWKHHLVAFIAQRRTKTPPQNAKIIVFTNKDLRAETEKWAQKNEVKLDKHFLAIGMPVVITANKPHPQNAFEYEHRNGQRGTLLAIKKKYAAVKDAETQKIIKVAHKGPALNIPQIKSGIAETADAAQGKTIHSPVHIIINNHLPDLPHIVVAATRSKITTFDTKQNTMATIEQHIENEKLHDHIITFTETLNNE